MKKNILKLIFASMTVFMLANSALAAVCVEINKELDSLEPKEQITTKSFVEATLEQEGVYLNKKSCNEKYIVYHLKLGKTITVIMSNARKTKKMISKSMSDLPNVYSQLVRSLLNKGAVSRKNVTQKQHNPKRVRADDLFYLSLGYGAVGDAGGASFGLGYRYELDDVAIDVSFLNYIITKDESKDDSYSTYGDSNDDDPSIVGDLVRLQVFYYVSPESNTSFYLGGGIGWGGFSIKGEDNTGINLVPTIGVEMFRASTLRMFIQLNGIFSTYKVDGDHQAAVNLSLSLAYD